MSRQGPTLSSAEDCTVYFAGAPQSATEHQIRVLFEQLGHVSGLKLTPSRTRPTLEGFVDFSDAADARAAVERLNGHLFSFSSAATAAEASSVIGGEYKLLVQLSSTRKRLRGEDAPLLGGVAEVTSGRGVGHRGGRGRGSGFGRGGAGAPVAVAAAPAAVIPKPVDSDDEACGGISSGPPLCLPKHYKDPISMALRANVSMSDAFEAMEQLRVISLERPDETKELLQQHPQLKVAVVQILQLAGKLPMPLPQEAFKASTSTNIRTIIRQSENSSRMMMMMGLAGPGSSPSTGGGASAAAVPSPSAPVVMPSSSSASSSSAAASAGGFSEATSAAAASVSTVQFTTEQLLAKVEALTEPQIAKIKDAKLEDFDKFKEPQRSLFKQLNVFLNSL